MSRFEMLFAYTYHYVVTIVSSKHVRIKLLLFLKKINFASRRRLEIYSLLWKKHPNKYQRSLTIICNRIVYCQIWECVVSLNFFYFTTRQLY